MTTFNRTVGFSVPDLIKVWRKSGFTLRLYDTGRVDNRGKSVLSYQLKDRRQVIFEGSDFAGSPMHADDSIDTIIALLSFLTLQPGDTDREYFDSYSPAQLNWCQSGRCSELSMIQYDIEHRRAR